MVLRRPKKPVPSGSQVPFTENNPVLSIVPHRNIKLLEKLTSNTHHHVSISAFLEKKDSSLLSFVLKGLGENLYTPPLISSAKSLSVTKKGKSSRGINQKGIRFPKLEVNRVWNEFSQSQPFRKSPFLQLNKPMYVCQNVLAQNILTTSASVDTNGAAYFTVGGLNQIGNFTALFDQYKIIGIEVWVQLTTTGTAAVASAMAASQYTSYIDYDDATAPASYATAVENQNAMTSTLLVNHYHAFVPHVAVATYSGTFTSFENQEAPWIDAASTGVQHYGLKVSAQAASTVNPIAFTAKLHMLWRQVR